MSPMTLNNCAVKVESHKIKADETVHMFVEYVENVLRCSGTRSPAVCAVGHR